VLAEPDDALGLAPARGRTEAGHYRGVLMRMLTEWEAEVNEALDDFAEFAERGKTAKLTATKKAKAKQPPPPKAGKGKGKTAAASSSSSSASSGSSSGKRRRGQ